ncbi:hypothetical protein TVAG_410860 [Trichomonas vaginalis G3]|uniref:Uncharacterized protein n=1 Tax=Trichomonas vaginalis (strain ATCC PRA-98 / G3) TaxID=412133 RepID=A2DXJ1_TRIV3|nr:hypothetical protein TVAGG3_0048130 [Trichomonas vaginalis G3]EAY14820.1 hypothetical protein TVAG_410860 [Trichomonas vaginalis G3]KAI5541198.1 hypothetical protein TVAGG3_0048130 [Trichomonas vaginalis G3]|eukprot:XP_001327043.1 hypothetical protein [Trichomonas vaginalis G3]
MNNSVKAIAAENQKLSAKINDLQREKEDLLKQIKSSEETTQNTMNELNNLKMQFDENMKRLDEVNAENSKLQKEVVSQMKAANFNQTANMKSNILQKQLIARFEVMLGKYDKLKDEKKKFIAQNAKMEQLNVSISSLEAQISLLRQKIVELTATTEAALADKEAAEKKLQELYIEIRKACGFGEKDDRPIISILHSNEQLLKELSTLRELVSLSHNEIESLISARGTQSQEYSELKKQLIAAQSENEKLLYECASLKANCDKLSVELSKIRLDNEQYQKEKENMDKAIVTLRKTISMLKKTLQTNEDEKNAIKKELMEVKVKFDLRGTTCLEKSV